MFGLFQTATVYTPHATTGAYSVTAQSNLACRLVQPGAGGGNVAPPDDVRAEEVQGRRLLWAAAYVMPDDAQVEIDSERYNVRAGTYTAVTGPSGNVVYRRCDVVEATS